MQSIINPRIGLFRLAGVWSGCNHGMAGSKPMNDENCGNLVIRGVQSGSHVVIPEVTPHVCQEHQSESTVRDGTPIFLYWKYMNWSVGIPYCRVGSFYLLRFDPFHRPSSSEPKVIPYHIKLK